MFDRPVQGRVFFEEVENVGRPDHVQLIRRVTRRTPSRCRIITEGVTPSLHVDYKHSRIKQYHKEGRALRTETVVNDTYDFGIGRRLCNLDALKRLRSQSTPLVRPTHDSFLGTDISTPSAHRRGQSPRLRPTLRRTSRHCCPFCWLFVCFPQALPIDNYENMRQRVCPPTPIHLTGRPAEAAVARTDASHTHIVTA